MREGRCPCRKLASVSHRDRDGKHCRGRSGRRLQNAEMESPTTHPAVPSPPLGSVEGVWDRCSEASLSLWRPPAAFDLRCSPLRRAPAVRVAIGASIAAELGKAMMKWNFTQFAVPIELDLHLNKQQHVLFASVTVLFILLGFGIFILCNYINECAREQRLQAIELQIMNSRQPIVAQMVASFTMTKYQPGSPSIEDHCLICLGEYCDGEDLVCPPCGHVLHDACLIDWFMHGPRLTCPCCRREYALDGVTI